MRIIKMKLLSIMKNKKFRSGKTKNKKKILNTKGKVDVIINGFEVIQTIHCSYRLGDFCRS